MTRMVRCFALVLLLLVGLSSIGWCGENYFVRVGQKFGRGIYNVTYSPLEIPKSMEKGFTKDQLYKMILVDPLGGAMYMIQRAFVGVYEVVTCPYPQKPILYPVYIMPDIRDYLFYMKDDNGP